MNQPWGSIQKAAATLQAGDTVLIRGGLYDLPNDSPWIYPTNSGTPDAYITYKAYPGESPILHGHYPTYSDSIWTGFYSRGRSYIILEGLTIEGFINGVFLKAPSHHIELRDCELRYNTGSGVCSTAAYSGDREGADYLTVEGCVIHHNGFYYDGTPYTGPCGGWGSGISLNAHNNPYRFDDNPGFHSVIRGNYIYHNYDGTGGDSDNDPDHTDGNGIIIDRGGDFPPILIENNVVFDNGGRGIHPYGSQNVWIVGNTLYCNGWDKEFLVPSTQCEIGGYATPQAPLKNIHVLNNVVYAQDGIQITYFPDIQPTELTMENNLWFGNPYRETYSPYGVNFVRSNPGFVNASLDPISTNFQLKDDSPAIDKGTDDLQSGCGLVDFNGVPRPQGTTIDLGAYEITGPIYPDGDYAVYVPVVLHGNR
jgi:parallel beta-helix repeat protein